MTHHNAEKSLMNIEKKVKRYSDPSVTIPDTSALIDLQMLAREYRGKKEKYSNPRLFIENLKTKNQYFLITKGVLREIGKHKHIKINDHVFELSDSFIDYIWGLYDDTVRFMDSFVHCADTEKIRYDAHWSSIYSCEGNEKKQLEPFSQVDIDLLSFSESIGAGELKSDNEEDKSKIRLVNILSSDNHILNGIRFLKQHQAFEDRYKNLNEINMRDR